MQHYPEREQLLASLLDSSYDEIVIICAELANIFVCTYMKCDIGREKYAHFQVEWHKNCLKFLVFGDKEHNPFNEIQADQLWISLTISNPPEICNPLMIAIISAVYGHMLQKVRSLVNRL